MGFLKKLADPGNISGGLSGETAMEGTRLSVEAQREAARLQQQMTDRARYELMQLFPMSMDNILAGQQGALDVASRFAPEQIQAAQGGNVAAQQSLLAALPQMQNAILGGPISNAGFQPYQQQINPSLFNFSLPEFQTSTESLNRKQDNMGGSYQELFKLMGNSGKIQR